MKEEHHVRNHTMRALVTGASGFVGGALAERLLHEGSTVHLLLRRPGSAGPLETKGAKCFIGSIEDPNEVLRAAETCEIVFHCAALTHRHTDPKALMWINTAGSENVLRAAERAKVTRIVHFSCSDVTLSNRERLHWSEDQVLDGPPLGAYARSKLLGEEIVLAGGSSELETTALRAGWVWGPGDKTSLPMLVDDAIRGRLRLVGNGDNLMPLTYIDHLVELAIRAAHHPCAPGRAFHVGDPDFVSAREFFGGICRTLGLSPPRPTFPYWIEYLKAGVRELCAQPGLRREDIARRGRTCHLDCGQAFTELDFAAQTGFAEGLEQLGKWVDAMGGTQSLAAIAARTSGNTKQH
ncbi:MAG: NAD-dependent epimerase/dehydratase family protein [Myxococcota bacterium]